MPAGSKQWIEVALALIGEGWSAELAAIDGNRVLGFEWEVARVCRFTLWFERPLVRDGVAVIAKHLKGQQVSLESATAFEAE